MPNVMKRVGEWLVSLRVEKWLFYISLALIVYMPLHIFLSQSLSLVTGGLEVWKAAKDVLITALVPFLLFIAYKKGILSGQYRWVFRFAVVYILLHLLYVIFSNTDDTYSAIVGSVYNSRLLAYLLLGLVVGASVRGRDFLRVLTTAAVLVALVVSVFGIAQYFLPHTMLENVGYSLERGVKPMFFIDDKPDFPRIMSTLRDPNSLGAYLILPFLCVALAFFKPKANQELFHRPFRKGSLAAIGTIILWAQFLTFSRGALLGLILSTATLLYIVTGQRILSFLKKYFLYIMAATFIISFFVFQVWNSYTFQNLVFHADQSTVLADPNELRVTLVQKAVDEVVETPLGHGPGTAGLLAITNPKSGILTENYYLQIAYEVGWLGLACFLAILGTLMYKLYKLTKSSPHAQVLFCSALGYGFYSLLIHLWSNEAVALQWWLLTGTFLGVKFRTQKSSER